MKKRQYCGKRLRNLTPGFPDLKRALKVGNAEKRDNANHQSSGRGTQNENVWPLCPSSHPRCATTNGLGGGPHRSFSDPHCAVEASARLGNSTSMGSLRFCPTCHRQKPRAWGKEKAIVSSPASFNSSPSSIERALQGGELGQRMTRSRRRNKTRKKCCYHGTRGKL